MTEKARKTLLVALTALAVAFFVHVDWHLGRPGHVGGLSFHLHYHWLFAVPTTWLIIAVASKLGQGESLLGIRRRELTIALLGVLIGQGLEPLWESWELGNWAPFQNTDRWLIFAEFVAAGMIFYVAYRMLRGRRQESVV